jgi:predicted ATPase
MNKVSKLALEQFTAFDKYTELEFSSGINVFIGANSTGKTHAMKAIYTMLKICEKASRDFDGKPNGNMKRLEVIAQNKFEGVFKPDKVGRLVRHGRGRRGGNVGITYNDKSIKAEITSLGNVSLSFNSIPEPVPSVFLPVHEFLSAYKGFIAAYEKRETAFDETYYDLAVALNASPLLGKNQEEIKNLVAPLKKAIQGAQVTNENGKFYIKLPEAKLEASLVAEGYRKLAGLIYLLNNGSLTQNGILFWDEPEANLNPRLVTTIVSVLKTLANSGVQIFVSTHDYLLSQELSLLAEYKTSDVEMQFFSFYQPKRKEGVKVEKAATLAEMENNPILEEFAAYYDRESSLFKK